MNGKEDGQAKILRPQEVEKDSLYRSLLGERDELLHEMLSQTPLFSEYEIRIALRRQGVDEKHLHEAIEYAIANNMLAKIEMPGEQSHMFGLTEYSSYRDDSSHGYHRRTSIKIIFR